MWDHAAGVLVVQEAGGVVTDGAGRPLELGRPGTVHVGMGRGIVAAATPALHAEVLPVVQALLKE